MYLNSLIELTMKEIEPEVGKTWRGGANKKYSKSASILTTIPKNIAKEYNLQDPTTIFFIPTERGILIKKLEVSKND